MSHWANDKVHPRSALGIRPCLAAFMPDSIRTISHGTAHVESARRDLQFAREASACITSHGFVRLTTREPIKPRKGTTRPTTGRGFSEEGVGLGFDLSTSEGCRPTNRGSPRTKGRERITGPRQLTRRKNRNGVRGRDCSWERGGRHCAVHSPAA